MQDARLLQRVLGEVESGYDRLHYTRIQREAFESIAENLLIIDLRASLITAIRRALAPERATPVWRASLWRKQDGDAAELALYHDEDSRIHVELPDGNEVVIWMEVPE